MRAWILQVAALVAAWGDGMTIRSNDVRTSSPLAFLAGAMVSVRVVPSVAVSVCVGAGSDLPPTDP